MSIFHAGITVIPVPHVGPPTTGYWERGTIIIDAEDAPWKCNSTGTPGTWTSLVSSVAPPDLVASFPEFIDTFPNGIAALGSTGAWLIANGGPASSLLQVAPLAGAGGRNGVIGVLRISTGTSSSGRAGAILGANLLRFNAGPKYTMWCRMTPVDLATAAQDYRFRVGFIDDNTNVEPVDGVYFEYQRSVSPNWICKTASNNIRTQAISTAVVQQAWWSDLKIVVDGAAGTATFYVDDVQVGQITTNVPVATGRETSLGFVIVKTAGTTSRSVDIDRIYIKLSGA